MSKRKTLTDQVGEQAVTIDGLRNVLSKQQADFAVLEKSYEQALVTIEERDRSLLNVKAALGTATVNVGNLEAQIVALKRILESKTSSYTYASRAREAAEAEIEQAHATLNLIPEAIPAEYEKEYGNGKHTLSARFMGTMLAVARGSK